MQDLITRILASIRGFVHGRRVLTTESKRNRALALAALVEKHLPADFEVHGDHDAWPLVATAMLAREAGMMLSLLEMERTGRVSDLAVLVRSLYEHTVYLAWMAGDDTAKRIEAWRKEDLRLRLAADRELRDHKATPHLTDAERATMERERNALEGGELRLIQLADEADKAWGSILPGFDSEDWQRSFKGMYSIVYRHTSGAAHPTWRGTHPVTEDTSPTGRRVAMEQPNAHEPFDPIGLGTVILGQALLVASHALGWPSRDETLAAFGRFPG
jgi:hypothetical protein